MNENGLLILIQAVFESRECVGECYLYVYVLILFRIRNANSQPFFSRSFFFVNSEPNAGHTIYRTFTYFPNAGVNMDRTSCSRTWPQLPPWHPGILPVQRVNKLSIPQIHDDKTEILLIGSVPRIDLPSSLRVGHSSIPFSNAARNLGVIFDRPACIEGTGEQTLSTCLPADQVDRFSQIESFF